MKHIKTFESFSQENNIDEGWREIGQAITKPFRKRTKEEVEKDAINVIKDSKKLEKLEKMLQSNKNNLHYSNYLKAKKEYENGNKEPYYNFICFVLDNWGDLENDIPVYYSGNLDTGDIKDTTKRTYSSGVGGRNWND